jgi:hypothetical protein
MIHLRWSGQDFSRSVGRMSDAAIRHNYRLYNDEAIIRCLLRPVLVFSGFGLMRADDSPIDATSTSNSFVKLPAIAPGQSAALLNWGCVSSRTILARSGVSLASASWWHSTVLISSQSPRTRTPVHSQMTLLRKGGPYLCRIINVEQEKSAVKRSLTSWGILKACHAIISAVWFIQNKYIHN